MAWCRRVARSRAVWRGGMVCAAGLTVLLVAGTVRLTARRRAGVVVRLVIAGRAPGVSASTLILVLAGIVV